MPQAGREHSLRIRATSPPCAGQLQTDKSGSTFSDMLYERIGLLVCARPYYASQHSHPSAPEPAMMLFYLLLVLTKALKIAAYIGII